jgi:hypothetical protein
MDRELQESPKERYENRAARFFGEAKILDTRSRRYSNRRLTIVLIGVTSVFVAPKNSPLWVCALAIFLLFLAVLFIALLIRHQTVEDRLSHAREMANRNVEGKARISRDWQTLPEWAVPTELAAGTLARDLDLFGPASLFPLVCTANTWEGRKAVDCRRDGPCRRIGPPHDPRGDSN